MSTTPETIESALNWRYATKAFDPTRQISDADWSALQESLRLSPSSYGAQPWKFLVIQSPEVRQSLAEATPLNRVKFETASRIVIVARLRKVDADYLGNYFDFVRETRNLEEAAIKPYKEMVQAKIGSLSDLDQSNWTARQSYIALGFFLLSAALLGIDAVPMEGIDPLKFDELLGLEGSDYQTVVAIAAGYRAADDPAQHLKKVRFDHSQVFEVI